MESMIIATYFWVDSILKYLNIQEDKRRTMGDSEIITTLIVAAQHFSGNIRKAQSFLKDHRYIPNMLEKTRFNRRQHALGAEFIQDITKVIAELFKIANTGQEYCADSFPVPICDNVRITRSQIYQDEKYRGYTKSKRRYFYGLKVHMIMTVDGNPVEFLLTPGSCNDCKALKMFEMNLPENSIVYLDKAYNDYKEEDFLKEAANIELAVQRKIDSIRPHSGCKSYIINKKRKFIETVFSKISSLLPKKIHAVTAAGFEMKIALFICAISFQTLMNLTFN